MFLLGFLTLVLYWFWDFVDSYSWQQHLVTLFYISLSFSVFSCSFGHCIVWTYLIKKIQKFIYPAPPDVLLPLAPPPPPLLRLPPPDHLFLPHLDFEELWVDLIPVSSPELKITKRKVNYKYQTIVKIIG